MRTIHFNYGPATLSRLYCRKCHEESIHKLGRCIHCKALFLGYRSPEHPKLKKRWNANPEKGIK